MKAEPPKRLYPPAEGGGRSNQALKRLASCLGPSGAQTPPCRHLRYHRVTPENLAPYDRFLHQLHRR
jgi:hypothetical protein